MAVSAFLTDATLCIGCKACEVACKEWNHVPADGFNFTGNSYDNTNALGASTWRHVMFLEEPATLGPQITGIDQPFRWQFLSDVCNGCGYCVVSCPFGVVDKNHEVGTAFKCTFCYDRQRDGLMPACAKACPTQSIRFGELEQLREQAHVRVKDLQH